MLLPLLAIGLIFLAWLSWVPSPAGRVGPVISRLAIPVIAGAALMLMARFGMNRLVLACALLLAAAKLLVSQLLRSKVPPPHESVGSGSSSSSGSQGAPFREQLGMSRARAFEVLNLKEGASRAEIIHAHRELIKKVHPDKGGSSYLAAQVNRARDVLTSTANG